MGRRSGSRNRDYAATRHRLAALCAASLLREDGEPASLTDLARTAGVSPTTLVHYFGDRDGVFAAAMGAVAEDSRGHLDRLASPGDRFPEQTLPALLGATVEVWRTHGLGPVFAGSLRQAIGHERRGPVFLDGLLEPYLHAVEALLRVHVERGDLPAVDVRATALGLLGPVLLALLHQDPLGGRRLRPLDVAAFADRHARVMVAGLRAPA